MDDFEFSQRLSRESEFNFLKVENEIINIDRGIFISNSSINDKFQVIQFINCEFSGSEVLFEDINKPNLNIFFRDCRFKCNLYVTRLVLKGLKFIGVKEIGQTLEVRNCKFGDFYFKGYKGTKLELDGSIDISYNKISQILNLENIQHIAGNFSFEGNNINTPERPSEFEFLASFSNSIFHNASFLHNTFNNEVKFYRMQLTYDSHGSARSFNDCKFESAYFNEVNFGERCFFNGSMFKNSVLFVHCKNLENTKADFSGCIFYKDAFFNYSEFNSLTIKNSQFMGITSFENTKFQEIEFERNIFEKAAHFDGIEVDNLENCNRKTLRTIKQELQRTENRIDYNIFKAAELNAYKKELSPDRWKEIFILWINNISSKHGLDWLRSSIFTLIIALLFYVFYFLTENYSLDFSVTNESLNHFIKGYFKFLLPTYKPPFQNGLSLWFQYLPFILGKIFIAYGIYQTIQAFRKFRL
ncbi:pentapeptide repeat-containing protein [Allomuricauda sp. CP2A]|jgi:uncharacterized protein YjbI with pentapeptide repeats|uniref:pentapeptide repeat-containing protein n=1 Tax=Allomuricauda sp. CP2A TaxID=1848189 RepID=UPI000831500B|nr:pentapeptide repeat-containing protein [Muricauda sp. CP2A]